MGDVPHAKLIAARTAVAEAATALLELGASDRNLLDQIEDAITFHRGRRPGWAKREADLVEAEQESWPVWMRPQADTDPARLADPDGVGNSELCEEEWVPTNDQAERLLSDMRVDRLEEIVRGGLRECPRALPPDAPKYMHRDNERLVKTHHALDELAAKARAESNQESERES